MTTVGIRELKNHLSRVLRRVSSGERITITDRGRPVALLTPVDERKEEAALWAMVREGLARWGGGKPDLPKRRVRIRGGPISDTVIEGRR
jgi:prevent-host-death family protein